MDPLELLLQQERVQPAQIHRYMETVLGKEQMRRILVKLFRVDKTNAGRYTNKFFKRNIQIKSIGDIRRASKNKHLQGLGLAMADVNRIDDICKELASDPKTVLSILQEYYFGDADREYRDRLPYYLYRFGSYTEGSRVDTCREYTRQPNGITLEDWPGFPESFQRFYAQPHPVLQAITNAPRLLPFPKNPNDATLINNSATTNALIYFALKDTVLPLASHLFQNLQVHLKNVALAGRPDVVFIDGKEYRLILEGKHPKVCTPETVEEIKRVFDTQNRDPQVEARSRPINQIVNYLLLNDARYGILSNLKNSFAFERDGRKIRVAPVTPDVDLIRLVYYLLHQSTINGVNDSLLKKDVLPTVDISSGRSSPPKKPRDTPVSGPYSLTSNNSTTRIDCQDQHDRLSDPSEIERQVYEQFIEWNFAQDNPVKILGDGKTGCVTLGRVWSNDSPSMEYPVASELLNEVRVLSYANEIGLKCVPKLRWAGYHGFGAQFYVVCTDYIENGYSKELDELNESESERFKDALKELREARIRHGDIHKENVIFTESRCFLVDFANATISKQPQNSEVLWSVSSNLFNQKTKKIDLADVDRIDEIFQELNLSLIQLFESTRFERLIKANYTASSNSSSSATSICCNNRVVNAIMPISIVSWDDFPVKASQYRGQTELLKRYPPIQIYTSREVSEENHIYSYLAAFDERTRSIYTLAVSPNIDIKGSRRGADQYFYVGRDLRAIGQVKCSWKLFLSGQNPIDLIEIYLIQREDVLRTIIRNATDQTSQESVPSTEEYGVYWAICEAFGYMVINGVKYGMLTTFNENWFLMHKGDGRLHVSPVVFCDARDQAPDSPGFLRAYLYFLSLLLDSEDGLPSDFVKNLKVIITDQAKDAKTNKNHQSSDSTTSQATERQVDYQFYLGNLGPCIGSGATGSVRVYRNYIDCRDGQVYPEIAIKFIDIGDSNERYELAINEVLIYKRLADLQGICVPRLLFHCSMYPYYIIAMELIEGKPLDLNAIESVESKLRCHLDSVHRCGVIHDDLRCPNILVDKYGEVWLIDFGQSYIDEDISLNKANEIENIERTLKYSY